MTTVYKLRVFCSKNLKNLQLLKPRFENLIQCFSKIFHIATKKSKNIKYIYILTFIIFFYLNI